MGWPTGKLLRFGAKVFALKKSWHSRYEPWRDIREEVKILGPAVGSSLTSTSYYVQSLTTNRCYYTDDVVIPEQQQPGVEEQVVYLPYRGEQPLHLASDPPPSRRVTGKSAPVAVSMVTIEGEEVILKKYASLFEPMWQSNMAVAPGVARQHPDENNATSSESGWSLETVSQGEQASAGSSEEDGVCGGEWAEAPNGRMYGGAYPSASNQSSKTCGTENTACKHGQLHQG